MCVMSLSVMPYHSDRSHIVSVTMMGAPTEKGEDGKRGKLELHSEGEHEESGLLTKKSLFSQRGRVGVFVSDTHIQLTH